MSKRRLFLPVLLLYLLSCALAACAQSVTQVGLRSVNGLGRFRGLKTDTNGGLYTLLDADDGVRLLKMDAGATTVLAEAHFGRSGDQGLSLALDPAGNVYVAGTSLSNGSIQGTAGVSYPARADNTTNSFLAKFTPALNEQWLTFLGSGRMAVTAVDASASQAVVTGSIFAATLPVTANGIQQQALPNSSGNGFVQSFNPATGTLVYSTYLSGANGDTAPTDIALDPGNNAYVVGSTTASGFPTRNALVPLLLSDGSSPVSGFLTKLTPAGDGFVFSTFIPGSGIAAIAADPANDTILLSGNVSPGLFPVTEARAPVAANVRYQSAVRITQDGSTVVSASLLAPGDNSTITASTNGFVAGVSSSTANVVPLLPVPSLQSLGSAFLLVANSGGVVQRTSRIGGNPVSNSGFSSVPVFAGGTLLLADGSALFAGGIAPTLSSALLPTERFDVNLGSTASSALPSSVRDALPSAACSGSACAGGAAVLARLRPGAAPSLLLSVDALPNLTLRNTGGSEATALQITATGYTVRATGCAATLASGSECDIALSGSGPGSVTVTSGNAQTASAALPETALSADPISITPKELDFGITAAATPRARTVTVTNLSAAPQTFASHAGITNSAFRVAESASTCVPAGDGVSKTLAAGAACTVTLQLAASTDANKDGTVRATWILGSRELTLTGYTQASALSLSATHLDFGRQYSGGLRVPRYLYLSNGSDVAQAHGKVVFSPGSPFQLADGCPSSLAPQSVCQMAVSYASAVLPSSDAATISIDGVDVLIDGQTVPQPGVTGATVNPNLAVTPASVTFSQPVLVTTVSSESQTVTVRNTGAGPFALGIAVTGDFTASSCPAMLPGGGICAITLYFTPGNAGTRQGLLSITAGGGSPLYISLTGTATAFLQSNGVVDYGEVPVQTPAVQWFKVGQPFARLSAATSSADYGVLLVEDRGYGHGTPDRARFQPSASGSCFSCYLGLQFLPSQAGAQAATLRLTSATGGASQVIALAGTGIPPAGVLLSPAVLDFGSAQVSSTTAAQLFTLTNVTPDAITTAAPSFRGDFVTSPAATGGTPCGGGTLQVGESCTVAAQFVPSTTGPHTGTLTITTAAGAVTAALTGYGDTDPGISFSPASLLFRNVPGTEAVQQTITVTNTGNIAATVGAPVSSDVHFQATDTCGTLAPGTACTVTVTYAPTDSLANGQLSVPVTASPGGAAQTTLYTLPLVGRYTAESAGLEIVPGEETEVNFGAAATGAVTTARVFRVNNLSSKPLVLTLEAPRQFPILTTNCAGLAAGASCAVTLLYAPLLNADATGTLFLQGKPTDGSATVNGLAYVQGYGLGTGTLAATGNFTVDGVIDFGQVPSGQSATETLTLTNQSVSDTITVRRVRAEFPFTATTDCGAALAPQATCTVSVTYAPNAQTTPGGDAGSQSNIGVLTLESDAANSPLLVDLAGRTLPLQTGKPSNISPLAALTTSQGALTFTAGMVGSASAQQTLTVTNTGTVALTIRGIAVSQDFTATNGCGALAVGASCQISVSFTPQAAGTRSGSLEIQSDAANALEYVSLLGSGTPAAVALTPNTLNFGQVLVGKAGTVQVARFSNTGGSVVTLGAVAVTGDYSILPTGRSGSVCVTGASLAPDATCILPVSFTPSRTGTRAGTLSVASSATPLSLSLALSGVGVQPQLAVAPSSLNFGDVLLGKTQTLALTLSNVSATAVDGLKVGITAGDYRVAATCGPVTLTANFSCSLNVTFAPTQTGTRSATLTIASNDPASSLTVPLTGNGLQAGSFTLTVNGAASGSETVAYGIAANYALALTPVNGFTGAVALTCTPQAIVQYTACSISPSTVTLTNGTVNATATITTVTAVTTASVRQTKQWRYAAICTLPVFLLAGARIRRTALRGLLLMLLTAATILGGGCGKGVAADPRIRYAAPGTYPFTVTAASTTGVPVQQSVALSLTISSSR